MTVRNDVDNASRWADKIVCRCSKSFVGRDHWARRNIKFVRGVHTSVIHCSPFTIHCSPNEMSASYRGRLIAAPTKYHSSAQQTHPSFTLSS